MSEHPNECQTDCPIQLPTGYRKMMVVPLLPIKQIISKKDETI